MDLLSIILKHFSMNTEVFFTGSLCGISQFDKVVNQGHLHLLHRGEITLINEQGESQRIDQPSVIFLPAPHLHRIVGSVDNPPELVCAKVLYNELGTNPIAAALPSLLHFNLNDCEKIKQKAHWLFEEAFQQQCGREPMLNSLTDMFIILILRHVLDNNLIEHGLLAGLSHPQIAKVIFAIQERPEHNWGLAEMAELALMSRSKFSESFKDVVGQSPGDYLIDWRINVAKSLLKQHKSVSFVANEVGYENGSGLARVFRKKVGLSPKQWLESLPST